MRVYCISKDCNDRSNRLILGNCYEVVLLYVYTDHYFIRHSDGMGFLYRKDLFMTQSEFRSSQLDKILKYEG